MEKKWKLIICDKDLNQRIGEHCDPKVIGYEELLFTTKEEIMKKYKKLIDKYMKISYDFKGHSEGAVKFYHGDGKIDYMTLLLVYYDGEEVTSGLFE